LVRTVPIGGVGFFAETTMGIDRIGGKGQPATPPTTTGVDRPGEAGRPFEIERPREVAPTQRPVPVDVTRTALERYRAGEIDLDRYIDLKVDEATGHLSALPLEDLEAVRNTLRDRLASDPTLVDLVRTATGPFPAPPGET
jgi:hypothetical protein